MPSSPKQAAQAAEQHKSFRILARAGFFVNGIVHVLTGGIALSVVFGAGTGGGGGQADESGAMKALASTPGGIFVLWFITIGLFGLTLWQVLQTVTVKRSDPKKRWGKRVSEASKGIAYAVIGGTALTIALGGSADSSDSKQSASAELLKAPGGVFVLVAIGLTVVGVGVFFCVRGFTGRFRRDIVVPPGARGTAVMAVGRVGYVAKGIALALVGGLFVFAAVTFDPDKAAGLDGALTGLTKVPFGIFLLIAIGLGLIAYGAYFGARARYAKL